MPLLPHAILTPEHLHGVFTPEAYLRRQAEALARGRRLYPGLVWPEPWHASETPPVYIAQGRWLLRCTCDRMEAPSVHPGWRLACCLNCGAIYDNVAIPAEAKDIEAVLLQRPDWSQRNWAPDETLSDLIAQNVAAGDPL